MRVIRFLLQMSSPYWKYLWGNFATMCIVALTDTLKPVLIKQLIDIVAGKLNANLWMIVIYYGILQFMLVGSWPIEDYCTTKFYTKLRLNISEFFMKQLYDHPYSFYQDKLSGNIIAKFNDVLQCSPDLIYTIIEKFFRFLFLIIISLLFLTPVSPIFVIILGLWIILSFVITFFSMKRGIALSKSYAEEKAKIIGLVSDYLSNMLSVKMFTAKKFELERFSSFKKKFIQASEQESFYFRKVYTAQGIFSSIYALGFIACLILGYKKGHVSAGDFALITMINSNIISMVYELSHTITQFVPTWVAVDQAILLLESFPENVDKTEAHAIVITRGQIVFDSVKFHYKDTKPLFQDKSVIIDANQKVGLVGYSGSGKTTFVNLLLRLYDISSGSILIDNQDISKVTPDSLRHNISMIAQDITLFHRSIMENIRYGRLNATDEEVIQAAQRAHANEFIVKLPQGYDTLVGERGIKLSGGQRQRIAIARAFLKNAPILILDEATSQLDSITENEIQESLRYLMQGKTTIVIAHRLSTLLQMDRILVFNQGKIVEDGTHTELLGKNGLYKALWDVQVGGFLPKQKVT